MKKITCINEDGLSAVFTYEHDNNEFFLVGLDGVYSLSNNIVRTNNTTSDGSIKNGESLGERNIVITANIKGNYQRNRQHLSNVFRLNSEGVFIHEEDGIEREISYSVESIDVEEIGVLRSVVISLICCNPFFRDRNETQLNMACWESGLEFFDVGYDAFEIDSQGIELGFREKEIIAQVYSENDSIGLTITLEADDTVINPILYNLTTEETLKLNCEMQPSDTIIITTHKGNKNVRLIRDREEQSYNFVIDDDLDCYLQLKQGINVIKYDADTNVDYLNVKIHYSNKYVMP